MGGQRASELGRELVLGRWRGKGKGWPCGGGEKGEGELGPEREMATRAEIERGRGMARARCTGLATRPRGRSQAFRPESRGWKKFLFFLFIFFLF
jgi:hypothetical protein